MIEKLLISENVGLFQKALEAASLRNSAIANNMANVDTPGYKRLDVSFEEELKKALGTGGDLPGKVSDPRHIPIGTPGAIGVQPKLVRAESTNMRNDGNNVDIDREMAALAKNQLTYNFLVDSVNGEFKKMEMAINGR